MSASFVDYDRDGWLDLYVGNYVAYDADNPTTCTNAGGAPEYCAPRVYPPQLDRLYRNRGDGTFGDASTAALQGRRPGAALGVVTADFDGDGWVDIYVANDGQENDLWLNRRDGTLSNAGPLSGAAVNADGMPEAGMGVDAVDVDLDGDEDLFMTHLRGETNTLYVNDGSGFFEDRSALAGLGPPQSRAHGIRGRVGGCRQRHLAGSLHRQRCRCGHAGSGKSAGSLSIWSAESGVSQSRRRSLRGRE